MREGALLQEEIGLGRSTGDIAMLSRPRPARPQTVQKAKPPGHPYSGMLSCFFQGFSTVLLRSILSTRTALGLLIDTTIGESLILEAVNG